MDWDSFWPMNLKSFPSSPDGKYIKKKNNKGISNFQNNMWIFSSQEGTGSWWEGLLAAALDGTGTVGMTVLRYTSSRGCPIYI